MVILRVNGVRVHCPTCWADVSTNTFLKIRKKWDPDKPIMERNRVKLFTILTGTDYQKVWDSTDYELEAAIWEYTKFVYTEEIDFEALPIPQSIDISGVNVTIPKNLGSLTTGQNMHVRQAINALQDDIATICTVAALYLQPFYMAEPVAGKMMKAPFDVERAKELEPLLLSMPITTIYPIGFFFLKKIGASGTNWLGRWLRRIRQNIENAVPLHKCPKPIS
jgi:hypothetical protein